MKKRSTERRERREKTGKKLRHQREFVHQRLEKRGLKTNKDKEKTGKATKSDLVHRKEYTSTWEHV